MSLREDYVNQFSFQVIRDLCRFEPYLSKGILYHKQDGLHNFIGYSIPSDTNGEKIDPIFTIRGPCIDETLKELKNTLRCDENVPDKSKWIFLPYDESDMIELEKKLDSDGVLCHHTSKYFFHRKRALTSYIAERVVEEKQPEEEPVLAISETEQ